MKFRILGNIPTKKNRQRIGRHGIYKPKEVVEYEDNFAKEIMVARVRKVEGQFKMTASFNIKQSKDLDGVLTTVLDCMQRSGVIENDKYLIELKCIKNVVPHKEIESVLVEVEPLII